MAELDTAALTSNLFFALPMGFTTGSKKAVHCQFSTFPQKSLTLPLCSSGNHISRFCFSSPHRRSHRRQTPSFSLTGSAGSVFLPAHPKNVTTVTFFIFTSFENPHFPRFQRFFQSTVFFCGRVSRRILLPTTVTDKINFHLPFLLPAM